MSIEPCVLSDGQAQLIREAGIPIPENYQGQTKSWTLAPSKYCPEQPGAGSTGVMHLGYIPELYDVSLHFVHIAAA